jgi:hypothetical protein
MQQAGKCQVLPAVQLQLLRAAGVQLTFCNEVKLSSDIAEHLLADDLAILLGFCFCCLQANSCCLLQLETSKNKAGNATKLFNHGFKLTNFSFRRISCESTSSGRVFSSMVPLYPSRP